MFTFMRIEDGEKKKRPDSRKESPKSQKTEDNETIITVVLPESTGPTPYRIAVPESQCCAIYDASEWRVVILKLPGA